MARMIVDLSPAPRMTDFISLGVLIRAFSVSAIDTILAETGEANEHESGLPARVMVH
jgi:hypothetical protein